MATNKNKYYLTANMIMRKATKSTAKKVTTLTKDTIVKVNKSKSKSEWYYVIYGKYEGYVYAYSDNKKSKASLKLCSDKQLQSTVSTKGLLSSSTSTTSDSPIKKLLGTNNIIGIHGAPYQFMDCVDRRISGTEFGENFAEDIIADMPLLMITPGEPSFLSGYTKKDKANILKILTSAVKSGGLGSSAKAAVNDLLDTTSDTRRYYTFKFDYATYYNYVNPMLWNAAAYLGIADEVITIGNQKNKKLSSFNWSKAYNKLKNYTGVQQFVSFFIDSENSIQESFSNETTTSQLGDSINSYSSIANELKFLQGAVLGTSPTLKNKDAYDKAKETLDGVSKKYLNSSKLIKNLGQGVLTVASGGKLLFPEIWSDSRYSKSYDISIKLRTPDNDVLSWYLNICVPMMHLIALAAPRQLSANGYTSPFLIRAFYKGLFNVDMGMIDNLSFTKGKEGSWTPFGLPTEVDVSMSIKDMYQALFISGIKTPGGIKSVVEGKIKGDDVKFILKNTAMMDYIASTCGVNINEPELARTVKMFKILYTNNMTLSGSQWAQGIQQDVLSSLSSMYRGVFGW